MSGAIRRRMLRAGIATVAIQLAAPSLSAAPAPACSASVEFDPPRAILGQQVILRVRISQGHETSYVDWEEPSTYDGARVEPLPDWNGREPLEGDGSRFRVREVRRALFPNRAGGIEVESSRLRCRVGMQGAEQEIEFAVPGASLDVVEAPYPGRPDDFAGTIGPIAMHAVAVPREIFLGGSIRLALMIRGQGDLWSLPDPLPEIAAVEVFRRRPEVTIETGPQLSIVRHFAYDIVPEREGELLIPGVRLRYFDPVNGRFELATTNPIRIVVGARSPAGERTYEDRGADESKNHPDDRNPATRALVEMGWKRILIAAALLCAAVGVRRWRIARRKRRRIEILAARLENEFEGTANPAAIALILRSGITLHVPRIESLSAEEIAALPNLRGEVIEAAGVLSGVERARFDPDSALPDVQEILRALKRL